MRLIQRRCGLIVICDGGEDPSGSYAALISAMTLIREDFGAELDLDRAVDGLNSGPAQLVAKPSNLEYPRAAEFASRGYFVASINYKAHPKIVPIKERSRSNLDRGLVIYLKATIRIPALTLPAKG